MNYLASQNGYRDAIACDSAGTSSYHIGAAPDRRMQAAARERGITLRGKARQFTQDDFVQFDLILAMDRENYRDILRLDPEGQYKDKVRMMCDFAGNHPDREVPDPYYGGADGFNYVIDLLLDACEGLLKEMMKDEG